MKSTFYLLFSFLAVASATAETTNSAPADTRPAVETELSLHAQVTLALPEEPKPNEVRVGNTSFEGSLIEAAKADNPLQLVNPGAPSRYGQAEENVARDPINGRITGLKLFSFKF